jgi:hypothetical protein
VPAHWGVSAMQTVWGFFLQLCCSGYQCAGTCCFVTAVVPSAPARPTDCIYLYLLTVFGCLEPSPF